MKKPSPTALARELRAFFCEHINVIRGLSRHTLQSYRDAFVLLLRFLGNRHRCSVADLDFAHLTPPDLLAYLDHLESERRNGVSTRNARLAAVHSFSRFVVSRSPEHMELCQRLLAIPIKRCRTKAVEYLESHELRAMLDATDRNTVDGRRDYTLLLTLFNTGARVQEILDIGLADLQLERPFQVRLQGKGQKERFCPLWPQTAHVLQCLVAEAGRADGSTDRLFRNRRGEPMTRFGVRYLVRKYARLGKGTAPSLAKKKVHPHTFRHTAAVHLLQAGVDLVSISHWLGHASVETTNRYATIDLETKRAALDRATPAVEGKKAKAWRTDESVLTWLESL